MARNSSYNALARRTLRRARRLNFDFGTGKISVPLIHVPTQISGEMLVSSLFTIAHASPYQKKVLNEARKVRKRILQLQKEGYTFPSWITDLVFGETITVSKKTLNKLQQMDMRFLRTHAASYKGETDINKIITKYNQEVADKRRKSREEKRKQRDRENGEQTTFDDIPRDLDIKIDNIIEEEKKYIEELNKTYDAYKYAVRFVRENYYMAMTNAMSALNALHSMSDEEKEKIVNFWEGNGGLYAAVEKAVDRLHGLYYPEFAPQYNLNLANLLISGLPEYAVEMEGYDVPMYNVSDFDFDNENDTEDFSDVPF